MKVYYVIASFSIMLLFICFMFIHELEKPRHQFDWTEIRSQIKDTVLVLEYNGDVSARFVGYDARESPQYFLGKWYMEHTTTDELHHLIDYKNGAIKAYSFKALVQRRDPKIFDYIVDSYNDKTRVYTQSGCIGSEFSLFEFYVSTITPPFIHGPPHIELNLNEKQKGILNQLIKTHNADDSNLYELYYLK